jgi:glutamate N-acetyltransferase/amino-acid N-acetyltransferase
VAGGLHCGIKKDGTLDLAIIYSETPTTSAGVFTKNLVKAAPVLYTQKVVRVGAARAVVINSGNANAVTGTQGRLDTETMAAATARGLNLSANEVAVASTGVIGKRLPIETIIEGIDRLVPALSKDGGDGAAEAIMTTDTFPKTVAVEVPLSKGNIIIGGMAKGAGMICPDLATMLAFITTDAAVEGAFLSRALESAVQASFNSITVDGDSSTNDTILMMASGAADAAAITEFSGDYFLFHSALEYVCMKLAEMIVRDGEGATKLIRVHIEGADDSNHAQKIAKTVANSLLVKTAIFGNDPNWGRIIAAAGRAGVDMDPDLVDISMGDLILFKSGAPEAFDAAKAREILKQKEVDIRLNLHMGSESATVLTCDISYDYVKINAEYTT